MERKDLFNVHVAYEGATWVIATAENEEVANQIKAYLEKTTGKKGFEFFIVDTPVNMFDSLEDYIKFDEKVKKYVAEDQQPGK